jgi:Fe-S oxidoreductase
MTTDSMQQNRLEWIPGELQTSRNSEYLYFVGCLPYYDPIFQETGAEPVEIAKSTLKILNYFDIKPQVLPNEKCCGHDFFWNGDIASFRKLAESNIEQFKQQGIKKIITSCPECYRTLKVEYPNLIGDVEYEVLHTSEFLAQKMEEKKITLDSKEQHLTFQDPCRLGRHLNIYEPPRTVMSHLKGSSFSEMAHHHKRATCCGVSSWMNCSQVSKQIQKQRLNEARNTGADILVTACPKCQIHFSCAMSDSEIGENNRFAIKDLTQVVAECLQ